jgi:hypothetical protein
MVLVDPDLNGIPDLSNVDIPTIAGDAINTWCFQLEVKLNVSSPIGVSTQGGLRAQWICLSLQLFCLNVLQSNFNSPRILS